MFRESDSNPELDSLPEADPPGARLGYRAGARRVRSRPGRSPRARGHRGRPVAKEAMRRRPCCRCRGGPLPRGPSILREARAGQRHLPRLRGDEGAEPPGGLGPGAAGVFGAVAVDVPVEEDGALTVGGERLRGLLAPGIDRTGMLPSLSGPYCNEGPNGR